MQSNAFSGGNGATPTLRPQELCSSRCDATQATHKMSSASDTGAETRNLTALNNPSHAHQFLMSNPWLQTSLIYSQLYSQSLHQSSSSSAAAAASAVAAAAAAASTLSPSDTGVDPLTEKIASPGSRSLSTPRSRPPSVGSPSVCSTPSPTPTPRVSKGASDAVDASGDQLKKKTDVWRPY